MGQSLSAYIVAPSDDGTEVRVFRHDNAYRRVIDTSDVSQLVEMSIRPNGSIPSEVHAQSDQTFVVRGGSGRALLQPPGASRATQVALSVGVVLRVRRGCQHAIYASAEGLELSTVYAPPVHAPGTYQPAPPSELAWP